MATQTKKRATTKKPLTDYYLYVPLGAGQLLVEKTKTLSGKAFKMAQHRRTRLVRTYEDLGKRGEKLARSIRSSASTRRAFEQTKTARSRVRAATTSVRKALGETAGATKAAAKKVG